MKTGDDTLDSMFDEEITTTIKPDGSAEVKAEHVPDEDLSDACQDFLVAEKRFHKANINVDMNNYASVCEWLDCLGKKYTTERRLWLSFVGSAKSVPAMQRLYMRFRTALVKDEPLKPNA